MGENTSNLKNIEGATNELDILTPIAQETKSQKQEGIETPEKLLPSLFEANCDLSLYPIRGTHKDLINDITSSQNLVQDPALVDKIAKLHGLQPHIPFAFQADLELQMAEKKIPQFVLAPSNGHITLRHIFQNPVKKSKNSHSTQGQSLHVLHSQTVSNNLFVLSQQPNQVQRKAYQTETRYILPNPLKLQLISPQQYLKNCTGTVFLVDHTEVHSAGEVFKSASLLPISLNSNGELVFSLQIFRTSGPNSFRFLFQIDYCFESDLTKMTQWVLSEPFVVVSNRVRLIKSKTRENQQKDQDPRDTTTENN